MKQPVCRSVIGAALLWGCDFSAGGVRRDDIEVHVRDARGDVTLPMCTELPVLWGAHVEDELAVAGGLVVRVIASSRVVELTITGDDLSMDELRSISLDELRRDEIPDIPIVTPGGAYTITIQAGCSG